VRVRRASIGCISFGTTEDFEAEDPAARSRERPYSEHNPGPGADQGILTPSDVRPAFHSTTRAKLSKHIELFLLRCGRAIGGVHDPGQRL
jgi:hypothetical protein